MMGWLMYALLAVLVICALIGFGADLAHLVG